MKSKIRIPTLYISNKAGSNLSALRSLTESIFLYAKMYFFTPQNHNFFGYPKISFLEPPQKSEPASP